MKTTSIRWVAAALVLGSVMLCGHGQEPRRFKEPKKGSVPELMREKLQRSQKLLEGIALNDFDKIGQNADELIVLSNKAEWRVVKTPQYEMYSNEFRRAAEDLVKHAKKKNLDAATLSYVEMTLNCVRCHKYVRGVRMTRLDP